MAEERTHEVIVSEIDRLIQELVHLEDFGKDSDFLLTSWIIAGTGISSTNVHQFRAVYYTSSELNPLMAAGIADYAYSRTRESISKRISDGRSE